MKCIIEYIGGYPEWRSPGEVALEIKPQGFTLTEMGFWSSHKSFSIDKKDIVNISFERNASRSLGKAAAGALIGGVLTGGVGLLVGGVLGAKKKNLTELYIFYNYKERELMLTLKTGKKTEKIYAELNGLFA